MFREGNLIDSINTENNSTHSVVEKVEYRWFISITRKLRIFLNVSFFILFFPRTKKKRSSERRTIRSGFGIRCLKENNILSRHKYSNNRSKPQGYSSIYHRERRKMEFYNHLKLNPILRYITLVLFLACTAAAGMCELSLTRYGLSMVAVSHASIVYT